MYGEIGCTINSCMWKEEYCYQMLNNTMKQQIFFLLINESSASQITNTYAGMGNACNKKINMVIKIRSSLEVIHSLPQPNLFHSCSYLGINKYFHLNALKKTPLHNALL